MRRALTVLVLVALVAGRMDAQELQGAVRDSASRQPIAGAVLLLLAADGHVLGRNITNEHGEYRIVLSTAMQRVRVLRLGFRPRELRIPAPVGGIARLDVTLATIPHFLEPVRVVANAQCPRRRDDGAAFALLEQAQAGLLASVVAREADPAAVVRYAYDQTMDGVNGRITRMTVSVDSAERQIASFNAVHTAPDFLRRGFMQDSAAGQTFFAPDADVLLDDEFVQAYCFRLLPRQSSRSRELGLGFTRAVRSPGRVDVDGALWIDTSARALTSVEFRFIGLDRRVERFGPGAQLSFRAMSNGVVMIDRWKMRLIGAFYDTVVARPYDEPTGRLVFYSHERGGILAHARWQTDVRWDAPLGALSVRATTLQGRAARGISVWLAGTPYRAVTDSTGAFEMRDLVPGPYSAVIIDSALMTIGLPIPTTLRFTVDGDSTISTSFVARTAAQYVVDRCIADRRYTYKVTDSTSVIVRFVDVGGNAVGSVQWGAWVSPDPTPDPQRVTGTWYELREGARTGPDGLLQLCGPHLQPNSTLDLRILTPGLDTTVRRKLMTGLNVFRIFLPAAQRQRAR